MTEKMTLTDTLRRKQLFVLTFVKLQDKTLQVVLDPKLVHFLLVGTSIPLFERLELEHTE